jgi:hypothetical protein
VRITTLIAAAALLAGTAAGPIAAVPHENRVVGVTVDDVSRLPQTLASLRHLPGKPWTREVLDVDQHHPASLGRYVRTTRRLASASHVMAELVDSSALRRITSRQLRRRTSAYLDALHNHVDLWEVGNEVNGNWTGPATSVARKVRQTYRQVNAVGAATAPTLYENRRCGDGPGELNPTGWSRRYLSAEIRRGIDEVLLSYYEAQCNGRRPSRQEWTRHFAALHRLFPNAQLGFGEIGLPRPATAGTTATASSIIRHYYRLQLPLPYYVGGGFYWYYVEDMTPWSQSPLWHTLRRSVAQP